MPRIRTIKPEFWTSAQVVECSRDARLLFIGLWNFCDDGGVHPDSPKRLKMEIFPGDDLTADQVGTLVDELVGAKLVARYERENGKYIVVTGWRHQKIEKPTRKHPAPPESLYIDDHPANGHRLFGDESATGRGTVADRSGKNPLEMEMEKEKEKDTPTCRSATGDNETPHEEKLKPYPPEFEEFYKAYPKHERKQLAFKSWEVAVKGIKLRDGTDRGTICQRLVKAAQRFAASPVSKTRWCPNASAWLNQGRYEDDPETWNRVPEDEPSKAKQRILTDEEMADPEM